MLKEIRRIETRSKANYIRSLQHRGKIKTYLSPKGYLSYDPDEVKEFQKGNKRGRPPKIIKREN